MEDDSNLARIATSLEQLAKATPWALAWLFIIAAGTWSSSDSVDDLRNELKERAPAPSQGR